MSVSVSKKWKNKDRKQQVAVRNVTIYIAKQTLHISSFFDQNCLLINLLASFSVSPTQSFDPTVFAIQLHKIINFTTKTRKMCCAFRKSFIFSDYLYICVRSRIWLWKQYQVLRQSSVNHSLVLRAIVSIRLVLPSNET